MRCKNKAIVIVRSRLTRVCFVLTPCPRSARVLAAETRAVVRGPLPYLVDYADVLKDVRVVVKVQTDGTVLWRIINSVTKAKEVRLASWFERTLRSGAANSAGFAVQGDAARGKYVRDRLKSDLQVVSFSSELSNADPELWVTQFVLAGPPLLSSARRKK